jgi:hypothetical protein
MDFQFSFTSTVYWRFVRESMARWPVTLLPVKRSTS